MAVSVVKVYTVDVTDRSVGGLSAALAALTEVGVPDEALLTNAPEQLVIHVTQVDVNLNAKDVFVRPG